MTKQVRSSNFELLRIFAMMSIIFYHCLSEYAPKVEDERLALSMYYILHWGVPVFLLISGFFSVKFSVKKIIFGSTVPFG
ncbi:MAG: acyltransferase family protein [Alloprevotella sp.]